MPSNPAPFAAEIQAAAGRLAVDPAGAERLIRAVLARAPSDPAAALILASARRRQGDAAGALAVLERLAAAFPRAAATQYELGAALALAGRRSDAVEVLRRAVSLNRDNADAWRLLGELEFADGDARGAERSFAEHAAAALSDPEIRALARAAAEDRLDAAEAGLRARLERSPADVDALGVLAGVYLRRGREADAEVLLAHSLSERPGDARARFAYASALFAQQKGPEALSALAPLLAADPEDAANLNLEAACRGLVGDHARSIEIYEGLLARFPRHPRIWLNYGHALRTVGRAEEAARAYRRCAALAPDLGDAYWSLANLKVAEITDTEASEIARRLDEGRLSAADRTHFAYALGKALEDRGDYAGAFARYAEGAALRRAEAHYDPTWLTGLAERSAEVLTREFFAARQGYGASDRDPIFIVGLPRSGSTLIEQILASHSAVEGTMELPDIGFIAQSLGAYGQGAAASAYPAALAALSAADAAALGRRYLDATRIHRKTDRPRFVDKMPNNFAHAGLIRLILPNARIIDARRHPMGVCFSAFKQLFHQGQSFSYDLEDLGRYYRDYVRMMRATDAALPGDVLRVIYEDVVESLEDEVRRILEFCGLPFEPACLRFHETRRAVKTVSSEQVRRPIYRSGVDQWRNFAPWLGPLEAALGPALGTWRE